MKKIIAYSLAIAALISVSCDRMETPTPSGKKHQITASIGPDTRTTYNEVGNTAEFSWLQYDRIRVLVSKATDESKAINYYGYQADAAGNPSTFTSEGDPDWDTYPRLGWAVYPALTVGGNKDGYTVTLPASYSLGSDLTAVGVPMFGLEVSEEVFNFTTAVGVLKFTLTNVPVTARKVVLKTSDGVAGKFALNADIATTGILLSTADAENTNDITVSFPQQTAGSTISLYMPVPVGDISAGATIEIQDGSGNPLKTTAPTVKAIPIARNTVLSLPAIAVEDWVDLGTGKYMDDHGFYYLGIGGRTAEDYADVKIEKSLAAGNTMYRITTPYASCPYADSYLPGAAQYLYIEVVDAENGIVANHSYKYEDGATLMFDCPWWGYGYFYYNNRILKYDGSGNPANIQLAPYYSALYGDDFSQNPKIEVVFPGAEPMLAENYGYAAATSAAYNSGSVTVTMAAPATSVKVKVASSVDAAAEALMDGTYDLSFDASDTKELTGLTLGENYCLVYMVETASNGYTLKKGGSFTYGSIELTSSMITVSTDATYDGGTLYDGAGYAALVDGNLENFWHSAYESVPGDDYDWANLDPTYGAYIDIALDSSIKTFRLKYITRYNNPNGSPRAIVFAVSNDGSSWTIVDTVEEDYMNVGANETVLLPILEASESFSYLRIGITKAGPTPSILTVPKGGSTSLTEIYLYGVN